MSKYNVGDKFIIEVKEVIDSERGTLYRSDFSTLVFDDYGLDHLSQLVQGVDTYNYNKGLMDAWAAAEKIISGKTPFAPDSLFKAFGVSSLPGIIRNSTPQIAIAKLRELEEQKEIKVGDEVTLENLTGVVISDVIHITVMWENGGVGHATKQCCPYVKTGRNFADKLNELLSAIGGQSDDV